jgi:hypothetical protein
LNGKRCIAETHGETILMRAHERQTRSGYPIIFIVPCCVAPHMQSRMTFKQGAPEVHVGDAEKIAQDVKPHGESVRVLDIEQGDFAFQTKF